MVRIFAILLMSLWASYLSAQTAETEPEAGEKGRIEIWLEEVLSSAGREVSISGFQGAFSSEARFDALSIADDEGIWLTIENATLNWSRAALLTGRVDINEIAADKITMLRRPLPGRAITPEDSQSSPFEVPELPVSLEIDKLDVASIELGAAVMGEAIDLSLSGSAQLIGGQVAVDLEAKRSDGLGQFVVVANFANENRQLDIDLRLQEARGGIVTTLLKIPDAPKLDLSLVGAAPLSDFAANLSLKTNQTEQIVGVIHYREPVAETVDPVVLGANVEGDLRPFFGSEFHTFFGQRSEFELDAARMADGRLDIQTLALKTGVLDINGRVEIAADGLPNAFQLAGSMNSDSPVRLPTADAAVTLAGAQFTASFDAAKSEAWKVDLTLSELEHDALFVPQAHLIGAGTIKRALGGQVTAEVQYSAQGLSFADAKYALTFDGDHTGKLNLQWAEGDDLVISSAEFATETAEVHGNGRLGAAADGLPLSGTLRALMPELARFSGLAGRNLKGLAEVKAEGRFDLLGGGFDAKLTAETHDLAIQEPRLDPLLAGHAKVSLEAARTLEGTTLKGLTLSSQTARIQASGRVDPRQAMLDLDAELEQLSLVEPLLEGSGKVKAKVLWQAETGFELSELIAQIAGTQISGNVAYVPSTQALSGNIHLISPDLSAFAKIAQRDLAGQLELRADGAANLSAGFYDLNAEFKGTDVKAGIAQLDALMAGAMQGQLSGQLNKDGISVETLQLRTPLLVAEAKGDGTVGGLTYKANLKDIAPLAPGINGAFAMDGTARLTDDAGQRIEILAQASGPAGLTLRAKGAVKELGQNLDLRLTGAAPLDLVNSFIAPNSVQGNLSYDLKVLGAPSLEAFSGQLTLSDARVALPDSGIVLGQVGGLIRLSEARAQLDLTGRSAEGGTFGLSGPISLAAGNSADLTVDLSTFRISDPALFETSLSGQVRVVGPLAQTARISGDLELGTTEIMVPSGNAGLAGGIPDIRHVNAPRGVAATLDRAGVRPKGSGGSSRAMPLDLVISAPNQIFVRGRGLDAELGGQLVLGGTTAEVAPSGSFELIRGRFDILGRRFVMSEGLINMRGSLDPFLRFVADTETDAGIVSVVLEGLASAPDLSFESEAGLPQEDAIAQLLFGRGLENISALQAASLVNAIGTLSGRSSGGLTGRLRSSLGLSDLDVTTTDSGGQQLRAGAYINENIYSEITIDSQGNQSIDLNLDITPNLKAKGGANSEGNTGIGIFFERDY